VQESHGVFLQYEIGGIAQSGNKSVIPAQAGIQSFQPEAYVAGFRLAPE